MLSPYDRHDRASSRRGVWTHWVPLAVTLTVATVGLAAWVWSQRRDDEDDAADDHVGLDYDNADYGDNPPYGAADGHPSPHRSPRRDDESYGLAPAPGDASAAGWGARMSGALRRTPSPQQFFDSTGKTVAAGVAAAGAVVGKALASIREEDKAYAENPWSEEADAKKSRSGPSSGAKRKTVAVVVSADTQVPTADDHEMASILSHIPRHNDFSKTKLYILIYAPDLKDTALDATSSNRPSPSLSSSYSNIGHDGAQPPGDESKRPGATMASPTNNAAFDAMYSQALTLVDKEHMILPFTTSNGHGHILRHIQPDIIYLQESLAGENGSIVTNLQTWMRRDIMVVVGAESGSGGLADSESEAERSGKDEQWWQKPERVGRGRGVVVVDGMRVHDDWARRVQGRE
ncbi:peroxin 22-like protein [Drechmeria coniospora]|uniref:Peroxin 22-like protein n=1 Tax=Drechmeria coniospora TaxID=98403 RepID=A0A151GGB7_DRECN|nr:peroxin 22-like protein [Drechmeria coniospora]KYK56139.1 peroxin 22-like protein [Drechmeria coniospora]